MIDLVDLAESHLAATYRWVSDPSVRDGLLVDRKISTDEHRAWFAKLANDSSQRVFAALADGCHIGNFGYRNLLPGHGTGELWMFIGPEFQGRRMGFPMLNRGLEMGFGTLKLRKVLLNVDTTNVRALLLYARAGFHVEGLLHADQIYQDRPVDLLRMALMADAFVGVKRVLDVGQSESGANEISLRHKQRAADQSDEDFTDESAFRFL
jgi:UDP-4-amino-4,6-dideoxy-N-acetyl-beta-L-altrosamine N-acetyltransferase